MTRKLQVLASFLSALLVVFLFSGCKVTKEEFDFAIEACKEDGGINYYQNPVAIGNNFLGDVYCNNGVVVIGPTWARNKKARDSFDN